MSRDEGRRTMDKKKRFRLKYECRRTKDDGRRGNSLILGNKASLLQTTIETVEIGILNRKTDFKK